MNFKILQNSSFRDCKAVIRKRFEGYVCLQVLISGELRLSVDGSARVIRGPYLWYTYPGPKFEYASTGRDRALVLCCDEKSQCQALERTQPGLPIGLGHIRTKTHDYTRHGTLTLFSALDYLDGKIFHNTAARHTHVEWLGFLKKVDREAPDGLCLHLIIDNYCTHKHQKVRSWLKWRNQRHRKSEDVDRFVMHFTPTSSSWMNMVERFFRDITVDCIRDGSFASVDELKDSILDYLNERNLNPKPYVWKAEGKSILEKIKRAKAAMPKYE